MYIGCQLCSDQLERNLLLAGSTKINYNCTNHYCIFVIEHIHAVIHDNRILKGGTNLQLDRNEICIHFKLTYHIAHGT